MENKSIKEVLVEEHLKKRLEECGFKVLKLTTPGNSGTMDRMILCPTWSPGSPYFVECKRPGKAERRLQQLVRDEWRARGCKVLDVCDTYERVHEIGIMLLWEADKRQNANRLNADV